MHLMMRALMLAFLLPLAAAQRCTDDPTYKDLYTCSMWTGWACRNGGWGITGTDRINALVAACPVSCADVTPGVCSPPPAGPPPPPAGTPTFSPSPLVVADVVAAGAMIIPGTDRVVYPQCVDDPTCKRIK